MTGPVKVILETSRLDRILRRAPANALEANLAAAEEIAKDIRANWSGHYPPASADGEAPAMRSENLDKSVIAVPDENIKSGKTKATIQVLAAYASALEFGTRKMAARPFIRPALKRAEKTFAKHYRGIIEK